MASTPYLKGRNSSLVRSIEPLPAVCARRPALKTKTSIAEAVVAKFRLGRMQAAPQYYFKAIIAILIAHITKMIAPIAIAIFIVSSSSLVIALPLCLGPKDEIARDQRIFGYRRSLARRMPAPPRRAYSYPSLIRARKFSPILSRKPVVESQRWSAPTRRARSLVM